MLFVRTLFGMVIAIAVAVVTGNFEALAMSIVCTAGLSLAIWLPVWFVVGWIVTGGWRDSSPNSGAVWDGAGDHAGSKEQGLPGGSSGRAARAEEYVRHARSQGSSDAEIREHLLRARWRPAMVDALLDPHRPGGAEGERWLRAW